MDGPSPMKVSGGGAGKRTYRPLPRFSEALTHIVRSLTLCAHSHCALTHIVRLLTLCARCASMPRWPRPSPPTPRPLSRSLTLCTMCASIEAYWPLPRFSEALTHLVHQVRLHRGTHAVHSVLRGRVEVELRKGGRVRVRDGGTGGSGTAKRPRHRFFFSPPAKCCMHITCSRSYVRGGAAPSLMVMELPAARFTCGVPWPVFTTLPPSGL